MRSMQQPDQHAIRLSEAERKLLCDILVLPDEYIDRIRSADLDADVLFSGDELEDLAGYIAFEINHGKGRKRQVALGEVHQRIEDTLRLPQEQAAEPLKMPLHQQAYTVSRLGSFLEEMEEATGINFDAVLEKMRPVRIGPQDKIDLNLTPTEKQLLLGKAALPEDLKQQIADGKRKYEFTLAQIDRIQAAVSATAKQIGDKKARRSWERLATKLGDIQIKYSLNDDPPDALERVLSGEAVSQAAVVRDLMMKVLEARKERGKQRGDQ